MVIRKAVKLAHIVCAVLSLSRPHGATSSQIYKFCSLKFNIRRDRKQFNRALQRAEDEDLVTCFQRRYRIENPVKGGDILWSQRYRRYHGAGRQRKRRRAGNKLSRTRTCKTRLRAGRVKFQKHKSGTSFCSPCNLKKRRLEVMKRRKCTKDKSRLRYTKNINVKGVILCKSFTCHCKRKITPKKTILRRSSRIRNKKEVEMVKAARKKKSNVKSKRDHQGKHKCLMNSKHCPQKMKRGRSSKSKKTCKKRSRRDVYREALRRPTRTVAHAESWDRINYSLRRNELENQALMKDSKMVKKILSARHGPSWDDLNKELRRIKSVRSFEFGFGQSPCKKRRCRA